LFTPKGSTANAPATDSCRRPETGHNSPAPRNRRGGEQFELQGQWRLLDAAQAREKTNAVFTEHCALLHPE
jgi:hypothetical protein